MLENMILIVFAIVVWQFRDPISNSALSCLLIIGSYFGNLYRVIKVRMRIRQARVKRKASDDEEEAE